MDDDHSSRQQTKELKRIAIVANALSAFVALCAIGFCILLLLQNSHLRSGQECVRRIDLNSLNKFYDVNLTGWDALVTRYEKPEDANRIATQMRHDIDQFNKERPMRAQAIEICNDNPDFQPE